MKQMIFEKGKQRSVDVTPERKALLKAFAAIDGLFDDLMRDDLMAGAAGTAKRKLAKATDALKAQWGMLEGAEPETLLDQFAPEAKAAEVPPAFLDALREID